MTKNNKPKTALVLTSISAPNDVMRSFAQGAAENEIDFIVIGDSKSPAKFKLKGCDFFSLETQKKLDFELAACCPEKHYARKNLGYLLAMQRGTEVIIESDDDNYPLKNFWNSRIQNHKVPCIDDHKGWINIYGYYTKTRIWPRGLPLEEIAKKNPELASLKSIEKNCPIQQGLANENPDVDAVYRLTMPLPLRFKNNISIALGNASWCPFNSQNTTFFKEAFPLLYLPAFCSFRMTDIWRSFVAQRIAWVNNWSILFHSATVWQDRNEHDLLRDFADEVPGYLLNARIANILSGLKLKKGIKNIPANMLACYQALIDEKIIPKEELDLLRCWLHDISKLSATQD
jgi:hypothetical protein